MERRTLILAGVALLIAVSVGTAVADSTVPAYYDIANADLSWSSAFSVAQFNMPGYTLTGVDMSFTGTIDNSSINVKNGTTASATIYQLGTSSHLDLYAPGQAIGGTILDEVIAASTGYSNLKGFNLASGATSTTYRPSDASSTDDWSIIDAPTLSQFTGSGTVGLNVGAAEFSVQSSSTSGTGSLTYTMTGKAGGTLKVIYDYEKTNTTPELGTFGLMGLSMLPVLGVAIRRRKRS